MSLLRNTLTSARDVLRTCALGNSVSEDDMWANSQALDHALEQLDQIEKDQKSEKSDQISVLSVYRGVIDFLLMEVGDCQTELAQRVKFSSEFLERYDEDYKPKQFSRSTSDSGVK